MMNEITVLLSAANSPTMPSLLDCFTNNGERKVNLIGVDASSEQTCKFLFDTFYRVPLVTDPSYVDVIYEICKKHHVDIYFPNISLEVGKVSKEIERFKEIGTIISVTDDKVANLVNNKLRAYCFLKENEIPIPKFYPIHSIEDFKSGMKIMGYPQKPVCIKIVNQSGSRGVRIIDAKKNRYDIFANEKPNSFYISYEDMLSILKSAKALDELMLVEYMPGNEYTVDLLTEKGKVLYIGGRENTVSLMSIAQETVVTENQYAFDICKKIVSLLNYSGNIGFDFMLDKNGKPVLMDINPRITATVSLFAAAGLNLPYLRIKQLLNEELPVAKASIGVSLKRRYHEIYSDQNGNQIYIGGFNND